MAYVRNEEKAVVVLTVEQERRRYAELRRELAALTVENRRLEEQVTLLRPQVTAARRKLTRMTRDVDAARAQAERIGQIAVSVSSLPEPVYGGRQGLEAAAAEMDAFEGKGLKLSKPRRGPSHGTGDRYGTGCRCDACLDWRGRKSARELARYHARKAAKRAA